jgi:hypothetical protein
MGIVALFVDMTILCMERVIQCVVCTGGRDG